MAITKFTHPSGVNVRIDNSDPKTWEASLVCAHCRIPHRVSVEDRDRYAQQAKKFNVSIDQIWECGKCFLAHLEFETGEKAPPLKTFCTHDVPSFSKVEGQHGKVKQ